MSWREWFVGRHTLWLERELEDLKKRHLEEMNRVITDNKSLREELERTRILLTPAIQNIRPGVQPEEPAPQALGKEFVGTPWMRIQARILREIEEQEKAQETQRNLVRQAEERQAKEN
jgi:hypothetical protein